MKDTGLTNVVLEIKISRTSKKIIVSQSHYMDKILRKFNKEDSVGARTPLDTSLHLSTNRGECVSQVEHSRVINSLMYLTSCIRPNLAYTVSKFARYMSNPIADHLKAIVRVLNCLYYTRNYGLHYTSIQLY